MASELSIGSVKYTDETSVRKTLRKRENEVSPMFAETGAAGRFGSDGWADENRKCRIRNKRSGHCDLGFAEQGRDRLSILLEGNRKSKFISFLLHNKGFHPPINSFL